MKNLPLPNRRTFLKTVGVAGAALALKQAALADAPGIVPKRKLGRHDEMVSSLGMGGHTLALGKNGRGSHPHRP